ncbi:MAG: molybdopterin converting factor subunit 1 [Planctomycetaceae bacterium]|nr:molybdopterin converting factor subunit 1 [Planctomycetaceae bacterium]
MKIQVRLFAAAQQLAAQDSITVECQDEATVADLKAALATSVPALESLLNHVRFAVNAEYVDDQTKLSAGDEVACIPPVSGG